MVILVTMTPESVYRRAADIAAVRADRAATKPSLVAALAQARRLKAWVAAQEAGLITQLAAVDSFVESTIAGVSGESLNAAAKSKERAETLADLPDIAAALERGVITAGHVDAITRGTKNVKPEQRDELLQRVDALADVAAAATIEQFDRRVKAEVRAVQSDDGEDRLVRQQRDVRLSTWIDNEGMWNLRGRFDPLTGLKLASRIEAVADAAFAERVPDHCPSDLVEKQRFLRAHALVHLITDTAPARGSGRPAFVAVIDADAPDCSGPVVQWPIPIELPARVIAELVGHGEVTPVVVRNGVVLHAPGTLKLGRSTRLANRDQRRALRGLYSTCAMPGCSVGFDRCKIHHIIWWRNGGLTDFDNLLPVCTRHHNNIHCDGWIVELGPHRELSLTLPDGTVRCTGPPTIRAA